MFFLQIHILNIVRDPARSSKTHAVLAVALASLGKLRHSLFRVFLLLIIDSFETTDICEQIIVAFNNKVIGDGKDATTLQIRYADTEEQKKLKTYTAIKRQFKADEYNEAVYGIPFTNYSPVSPSFHNAIQARGPSISGSWINPSPASSISPA